MEKKFRDNNLPFKPRARMLVLLGEQLIKDPGIAVFELVKNAYDADALSVDIMMTQIDIPAEGQIVIQDDGVGMDWDIVTKVWLEPGTDYREVQKNEGTRTALGRTPLGEKGVGRFAVHKLGRCIKLVSRQKSKPEIVVDINWKDFFGSGYLSDTPVSVKEREPVVFTGAHTGTRIEISDLSQEWNRAMVRNLHRSVTSIASPFREPSDFKTKLAISPQESWLEGLLELGKVMEFAIYEATCIVDTNSLEYEYSFNPPPGMDRVTKRISSKHMPLTNITDLFSHSVRKSIGNVLFDLRIFDLDPQVLEFAVTDKKGLRDFMRQNGGIRVYRDGLRVFDYGEPGNDWLELGTRRVNIPTKRVSNNLIIGAVHLQGNESRGLIEKTNREGFVESDAFIMFKDLIYFSLVQIETERNQDKDRIRKAYDPKKLKEPVLSELSLLREEIEKRHIEKELAPYIDSIETQFRDVRDKLLTAAGPGLTMQVVIHEVEKGIKGLVTAVQRSAPMDDLSKLAEHLAELVDGLTYLTRRSGNKAESAENLIKQAFANTGFRTREHGIKTFNGIDSGDENFKIKCTRRMIIATLMNLIDNSIFWLSNKGAKDKRIYIGTTRDLPGGPAIVVADNGPGFSDPPEYLIEPFITRRPDGMGLGLHIAHEIMKTHGGKLVFPEPEEISLPKIFSGAVVALQFKDEEK